ncbi:hypothetical protein B0H34DRAFT_670840 [Crassisporium funariophilum]|nr:hypothetical protein B0H34DRAFT_670840 [Crassisporium funariophilum]
MAPPAKITPSLDQINVTLPQMTSAFSPHGSGNDTNVKVLRFSVPDLTLVGTAPAATHSAAYKGTVSFSSKKSTGLRISRIVMFCDIDIWTVRAPSSPAQRRHPPQREFPSYFCPGDYLTQGRRLPEQQLPHPDISMAFAPIQFQVQGEGFSWIGSLEPKRINLAWSEIYTSGPVAVSRNPCSQTSPTFCYGDHLPMIDLYLLSIHRQQPTALHIAQDQLGQYQSRTDTELKFNANALDCMIVITAQGQVHVRENEIWKTSKRGWPTTTDRRLENFLTIECFGMFDACNSRKQRGASALTVGSGKMGSRLLDVGKFVDVGQARLYLLHVDRSYTDKWLSTAVAWNAKSMASPSPCMISVFLLDETSRAGDAMVQRRPTKA